MESMTKIVQWGQDYLLSKGYIINKPQELILETPWSRVIRFLTMDGYIYLKQIVPILSVEPLIINILYEKFQENMPVIVGINENLNCFLMKDAGTPLREILKKDFQSNLLCEGIKKYTQIQCAMVNHGNIFFELGVPDWRLEKLPILYDQLINQDDLLISDGMTTSELNFLRELYPKLTSICKLLANHKIPETLDHGNFNDNNVLVENNTNNITIIDWSDAVITHPFISLAYCLRNVAHHHNLKETDKTYLVLRDACLENWLWVNEKNNLLEAFFLAQQLMPLYLALWFYRLKMGVSADELKSYPEGQGWLSRCFREFIKTFNDFNGVKSN